MLSRHRPTCLAPSITASLAAAALAATLAGVWAAASPALAAARRYAQDEVEAAFLYRFAEYVRWPREALASSVFTIAVLDDDAIAGDLRHMLPHGDLEGRRVRIRRIASLDRLGDIQILYIGRNDASILKRRPAPLSGRHVLVVTSQPGGLGDGSTINFLLVGRHVRFEISLSAARRAGLHISAELLSVAARVEGHPTGLEAPCETSPPLLRPNRTCAPRLASR